MQPNTAYVIYKTVSGSGRHFTEILKKGDNSVSLVLEKNPDGKP